MREILGVKQETLAQGLGISQQAISRLEQSEKLDDERLEEVAKVLGIRSEAIKGFNEEMAIQVFVNTITNNDQSSVVNYFPTFNPMDKIVELYDALLKEKDEKIILMERFQWLLVTRPTTAETPI